MLTTIQLCCLYIMTCLVNPNQSWFTLSSTWGRKTFSLNGKIPSLWGSQCLDSSKQRLEGKEDDLHADFKHDGDGVDIEFEY